MSNYYNMPKLPTEASPKVEIFVDDKAVMVPGDTNLLEALKAVGIETPHVCYHPYLPVSGNCRQCLVEQEGPRGRMLVISCYTPVTPGMKIYTPASSARVKNARKATQEFMLVNHPLDCPICDKAGECTLQENYMEAGQNEGRLRPEYGKNYHGNPEHQFIDAKGQLRGGKHVDIGPRILLDEERCVQCDRCVRFMRSIAKDEQLQLAGRADHTYITTFPGEKLDHEYDLCCWPCRPYLHYYLPGRKARPRIRPLCHGRMPDGRHDGKVLPLPEARLALEPHADDFDGRLPRC